MSESVLLHVCWYVDMCLTCDGGLSRGRLSPLSNAPHAFVLLPTDCDIQLLFRRDQPPSIPPPPPSRTLNPSTYPLIAHSRLLWFDKGAHDPFVLNLVILTGKSLVSAQNWHLNELMNLDVEFKLVKNPQMQLSRADRLDARVPYLLFFWALLKRAIGVVRKFIFSCLL